MFGEVADYSGREAKSKVIRLLWENRQYGDTNQGDANERLYGKGSNFNQAYVYNDRICPTLASKESCLIHYEQPRFWGKVKYVVFLHFRKITTLVVNHRITFAECPCHP